MVHEVFISYSRRDRALCDQVVALINGELGYKTFRDVDDFTPGYVWREQIKEALEQPGLLPYVVLLSTKAAQANPDRIEEELRTARELGLTVIPIEFDSGVTRELLGKAGFPKPGAIDYADPIEPDANYAITAWIEDKLRRALTSHVSRRLDKCRLEAQRWSEGLRKDPSFWEAIWRSYFSWDGPYGLPRSVVLTARGGSGKSFLLAHCVRELLDRPDVYPILVNEEMLRTAATSLPQLFGARDRDLLARQIDALAAAPPPGRASRKPLRVIFVVDGLDQMVVPGDAGQRQLVAGLNLLSNVAPVLIGCREEIWESYADRVSVLVAPVAELDQAHVEMLLRQHGLLSTPPNPLLKVPLFLDVALSWAGQRQTMPPTATAFLSRMWSDAVAQGGGAQSVDEGRDWLIHAIAELQLRTLSYDVPVAELKRTLGFMWEFEQGLTKLRDSGVLVVKVPQGDGSPTVRLRHDLVDNYSMLRVLLFTSDKSARIRDLCNRCDKDCGWSLLAMLIRYAHDEQDEAIRREVFSEFLFILDRKRWDDGAMARAWAVTHALRDSFDAVFDLIIEVLGGEPLASLDRDDPAQRALIHSTLGPPARLTQEAASTLASAFMRLEHGDVRDAAKAVPVLAAGLRKWPLRARFLEALGKFNTPEALDAIIAFARSQLERRDDIDVLLYVARSLAAFDEAPGALDMLRKLARVDLAGFPESENAAGRLSRLHRIAAEVLYRVRPNEVMVPLSDEDEIIFGLRIWETNGGRYSDWHEVQGYAIDVGRRRARGETFGPRVLQALVGAMEHDQSYVRGAVARALGYFDALEARDALLAELKEVSVSAEVRAACFHALRLQANRLKGTAERQGCAALLLREADAAKRAGATLVEHELIELARHIKDLEQTVRNALLNDAIKPHESMALRAKCLEALGRQLRELSDPKERQLSRFLLLRAATVSQQNGDTEIASRLRGLATDSDQRRPNDWLATAGALEVVPPAHAPLVGNCTQVTDAIDALVLQELATLGSPDRTESGA